MKRTITTNKELQLEQETPRGSRERTWNSIDRWKDLREGLWKERGNPISWGKVRLAGWCSLVKDHNPVDFKHMQQISSDEHVVDLSSANVTATSILQELDSFAIP